MAPFPLGPNSSLTGSNGSGAHCASAHLYRGPTVRQPDIAFPPTFNSCNLAPALVLSPQAGKFHHSSNGQHCRDVPAARIHSSLPAVPKLRFGKYLEN